MSSLAQYLGLNPEELALFDTLFKLVDAQGTGFASGKQVSNLFVTSQLPRNTLAAIWNIACSGRSGKLDRDGFFVGCRLIALAQQSLPVTQQSLTTHRDVPLPMFYGPAQQYYPRQLHSAPVSNPSYQRGAPPGAVSRQSSVPPQPVINRQMTPPQPQSAAVLSQETSPSDSMWEMTEDERRTYLKYFDKADEDQDGYVNGREAKAFFTMSKLSSATLREIWLMSDVDQDNKLNREEFVTAMHLIMRVRMRGTPLPRQLPACLDPRQRQRESSVPPRSAGSDSAAPDLLGPMSSSPLPPRNDSPASLTPDTGQPTASQMPDLMGSLIISGPSPEEQQRQQDLERKIASTKAEIEEQRVTSQGYETKLTETKSKIGPLEDELAEREAELATVSAKCQEHEHAYENVRNQVCSHQDRISEFQQELQNKRDALQDIDKRLAQGRIRLQMLTDEKKKLSTEVESLTQQVQDKELAVVCLEQSIADLNSEIEHTRELSSYQVQILEQHTRSHEAKEAEEEHLRNKLAQSKRELEALKSSAPSSRNSSPHGPSTQKVEPAASLPPSPQDSLEWPSAAGVLNDEADFSFPELSPQEFLTNPVATSQPQSQRSAPSQSTSPATERAALPQQSHRHAPKSESSSTSRKTAPASIGRDLSFDNVSDLEFPMMDGPDDWNSFPAVKVSSSSARAPAAASTDLASVLDSNPFDLEDNGTDPSWGKIDAAAQKQPPKSASATSAHSASAALPPDKPPFKSTAEEEWPSFDHADAAASGDTWAEF